MDAILISYDDVKSIIAKNKNRKFKRYVARKMGGKDSWNACPASFREMRDKGVDILNLIGVFVNSPKIPLETKRLYALSCAKRCLSYFSPKIANKSVAEKAIEVALVTPVKTSEERKKSDDVLFEFWETSVLRKLTWHDLLGLEVLIDATDRFFSKESASYCSVNSQLAAFYSGGKKAQEKERQQQLNDIIRLTELENQVGEKLA